MPKFSVIIPLYNKAAYIEATLESVLAQTFTDYEIVVVDDGSSDGSAEIVQSFIDPRIKYLKKANAGASSARNHAMRHANGDYFAFLDADDLWEPYHLQLFDEAIGKMPDLRVYASLLLAANSRGNYKPVYTNLTHEKFQQTDFFSASLARTILSGSTTVIHKSVREDIGEFDTSIATGEDTDYWIRIGFKYAVGVVNKITAKQVYVRGSLSNQEFSMANSTYFEKFCSQEQQNPAAKKMIDINRYSLALRCKMAGDNDALIKLISLINPASLSLQQKLLLNLPGWLLRLLQKLKAYINVIS